MGRPRAEALHPLTDLLASGAPPAARTHARGQEPRRARGLLASSPTRPLGALLLRPLFLHTPVPYLKRG